jgi:hypothetical protein
VRTGLSVSLAAAFLGIAVVTVASAQTGRTYSSGQNVAVAYEGWEENLDGSFNLVFGYLNRNYDEAIDVPVGPENSIEPGGPDQGQPTHFLPRRNRFVFKIRVPKDFGDKEIVWTLTSKGKTEKAYGTLRPDYFIDESVVTMNFSRGVGDLELLTLNKAPKLQLESGKGLTAKVGQPLTLTAVAHDDKYPKPRNMPPTNPQQAAGAATSSAQGLRLAWFVYRGAGNAVNFDPPQFKVQEDFRAGSPWAPGFVTPPIPEGNKWVVRATFAEPGTYVLRCLAHDGALQTYEDVTVTVTE